MDVSRSLRSLRLDRPFSGRELGLAWAVLALLGVLTFLPHILHGGFYLDDWSNGALTLNNRFGSSFGQVISSFAETTLFRPGLVIYVPLTYWVFGMHPGLHLAWATLLAIFVSWFLYAVLRKLDVPWVHALAPAALTLVYPWFDATRLWGTGDQVTLSTALALAGLWLSLVGLERGTWRRQAAAMVLFGCSILTYEITTPAIVAFGLIYVWRFGWQRSKRVWAADLAVVAVCGAWVLSHTPRTKSGLSGGLHHLWMIVKGGAEIVARSLFPIGPLRTSLAVAFLAVVFAAGLLALWRLPRPFPRAPGLGLRGWLVFGGAGLALTVLGWAVFVPADTYYTPSIYGVTNRVNGIGGIGAILLIYGAFGVTGTLVARLLGRRAVAATLMMTVGLGLALGAGYLHQVRHHIDIWNAAWDSERQAMEQIRSRYPTLPRNTAVYVTDWPAYQALGVPILSAEWDLDGMVRSEYGDGTLRAYPLLTGYEFSCQTDGLAIVSSSGEAALDEGPMAKVRPYRTVRVLSLGRERAFEPRNQAECRSDVASLEPGKVLVQQY